MTLVFKILATEEWRAAEAAGAFAGSAVDQADGYIHLSTAEQAPETAAKRFAGRRDLTLVAVNPATLARRSRPGVVARGRALSAPLYDAPAGRRCLVAPAAAECRRPARLREPRGVRLAALAQLLAKLLPAETAHQLAVNGMKIAPPAPARPRDPRLVVAVLGLKFPNPLGLAAGFDKNAKVPGAMLRLGFGFVEIGTLRLVLRPATRAPASSACARTARSSTVSASTTKATREPGRASRDAPPA